MIWDAHTHLAGVDGRTPEENGQEAEPQAQVN